MRPEYRQLNDGIEKAIKSLMAAIDLVTHLDAETPSDSILRVDPSDRFVEGSIILKGENDIIANLVEEHLNPAVKRRMWQHLGLAASTLNATIEKYRKVPCLTKDLSEGDLE